MARRSDRTEHDGMVFFQRAPITAVGAGTLIGLPLRDLNANKSLLDSAGPNWPRSIPTISGTSRRSLVSSLHRDGRRHNPRREYESVEDGRHPSP